MKQVYVFRLVAEGSIEERMLERAARLASWSFSKGHEYVPLTLCQSF